MASFTDQLDQRVIFQSKTHGKDSSGGHTEVWLSVKSRWAGFRHLGGAETKATSKGGGVEEARTEITLWYDPEITAAMRVVHKGKYYNIRHVNNFNEKNEKLILTCDTGAQVVV